MFLALLLKFNQKNIFYIFLNNTAVITRACSKNIIIDMSELKYIVLRVVYPRTNALGQSFTH